VAAVALDVLDALTYVVRMELPLALAATVISTLVTALTARTRGPDREETAETDSAGLVAWMASVLLFASYIRRDSSGSSGDWHAQVHNVRLAATLEDSAAIDYACRAYKSAGSRLALVAELENPHVRHTTRGIYFRSAPHAYRWDEQIAMSLLSTWGEGPPTPEAAQSARAIAGLLEATPPDVAESLERTNALLKGFLGGLDFESIEKLDPAECERVGRESARDAVASLRWSQVVGDRLDTTAVTQLLGVTRQALAQRLAAGTIHGLPGRRTTHYPTWQFDEDEGRVRQEAVLILAEFRNRLGANVDQFLIASWMSSPQSELDGMTPIDCLELRGDTERLIRAARHSAAKAAS
jgi:hypothetical protein